MRLPWVVQIRQVDNRGVVVTIGCKEFVFQSHHTALNELERLLSNPEAVMAEYAKLYGWDRGISPYGAEQAAKVGMTGSAFPESATIGAREKVAEGATGMGISGDAFNRPIGR